MSVAGFMKTTDSNLDSTKKGGIYVTILDEKSSVLLDVIGLKKYFPVSDGFFRRKQLLKAVDDIHLTVRKGETLGIVGESGCGKSTLAHLMTNLLKPTAGQIIFDGIEMNKLSKRERRKKRQDIQMIFQDPFSSLNPRMKVFDIIAEPLRAHQVARGTHLKRQVNDLLQVVGLDPTYSDRYPHEFSGGQRQRISIARAIALKPKLIVCDEPVSSLDVSVQSQILNLLETLQKEFHLTYIFIAHGLAAVKHISDRIAVMYLGKIVELASTKELFMRPLHPYTLGLISAVPIPDPTQRHLRKKILLEGEIPNPVNPPSGCSFHPRCPFATEKCKNVVPQLREISEGHVVACHHPRID